MTCSSSAPAARDCAPRSRHQRQGVRVGLLCKSLLGQGPHGHGRRRHRRGARQRRRPRQLEGAFRRHHARRPVRQQLADGGAARQRSPRSGPRAGGVGRGLRPHRRRPHPPAQLRRPQVPAPGARRRSHRPRDDPHAAGSRHPPRPRRPHGVHRRRAAHRRSARRRRVRLRPRARTFPGVQGQGGRARDRRHRPRLPHHQQQLGRHRRRPRAGLSRRAPS